MTRLMTIIGKGRGKILVEDRVRILIKQTRHDIKSTINRYKLWVVGGPIITIGLKDILDGRQTIPRAASQ